MLRGVVENLRSNRVVVPLFGLAIAAMFPQWVGFDHLAGWYCQMMLGLVPQVIVLARFPDGALDAARDAPLEPHPGGRQSVLYRQLGLAGPVVLGAAATRIPITS